MNEKPTGSQGVTAAKVLEAFLTTASAQSRDSSSFGAVVSFVNRHSRLLVLSDDHSGASIAVLPAMQGRVRTSSAEGDRGQSFGWVNCELIGSGEIREHINAVGGEDRIWIGPEGGQFSIFFAPGVPFDLDHWFTPAPIDTDAFDVVYQTKSSVAMCKAFHLINYSGTRFHLQIDREVRLLTDEDVWGDLRLAARSGVRVVGYESVNTLTNIGASKWRKETGLLSLWVLGQFQSTPQTTIILPIREGSVAELGIPVTADYFGSVPADRIVVRPDAVFLKADSHYRSKLGVSPQRGKGVLGSYDAQHHVLTIVQYNQPSEAEEYVNSAWKIQSEPYKGDVANCYNDGPLGPGKPQLGSFYELESSSPAKALRPQESIEHVQRTIHLVGIDEQLDAIAKEILGVNLADVREFIS